MRGFCALDGESFERFLMAVFGDINPTFGGGLFPLKTVPSGILCAVERFNNVRGVAFILSKQAFFGVG